MISLTFPDGSSRDFKPGVTGRDVAESISKSLGKKAVAMALDGKVKDLAEPIKADAKIRILTRDDPDALALIRHDAAHVMAEAVQELYPGTQVTIGPVIENGFYYDFARPEPFTPEDLPVIEAKMREIVARDSPFTCEVMDRAEAKKLFAKMGEKFKLELIDAIPEGEEIKIYSQARMARPLPRPAYDLDGKGRQRLQAAQDRRRLLARGLQQPDAPAHLRHGLGERGGACPLSASARRGREARPPPLGPRDGSVPFPGGGAWRGVLASQGLDPVSGADRLYAPSPAGLGLCRGQLPRHARPRAVGAIRPLGEVCRSHVYRRDAGRARLCLQADELPWPCADLQARPEKLPRSSLAPRRVRQGASLRAVGRAARPLARAPFHPGRRAYLLHRGSDHGRMRAAQPADAVDLPRLRLYRRGHQVRRPSDQARRIGRRLGQG